MAQNFRRYLNRNIGTTDVDVLGGAADSNDTLISIRLANVTTSTVQVDAYVKNSTLDYYVIKNAPIISGGSLELIDGGSKIVLQSGDQLFVVSDTATSVDCIVGAVDDIST